MSKLTRGDASATAKFKPCTEPNITTNGTHLSTIERFTHMDSIISRSANLSILHRDSLITHMSCALSANLDNGAFAKTGQLPHLTLAVN